MKYPIPDAALDDRLAVVGTSGSGKTYLTIGAMARLLKIERQHLGSLTPSGRSGVASQLRELLLGFEQTTPSP